MSASFFYIKIPERRLVSPEKIHLISPYKKFNNIQEKIYHLHVLKEMVHEKVFSIHPFICVFYPNISIAKETIDTLEKEFLSCCETYKQQEQKCSESWSMKCYDHLMMAHKNTQQCFQKVAVKLYTKFYGLSEKNANKKIDDFIKFTYNQYFFIFAETDFCKKNNCGLSIYLHSEYTTTDQLRYYINKIIRSISARN